MEGESRLQVIAVNATLRGNGAVGRWIVRSSLLWTWVAIFFVVAAALPSSARAAQAVPSSQGSCVIRLEHAAGSNREAYIESTSCFDTPAAAMEYASRPLLTATGTTASVWLGIDYDFPNQEGEVRIWEASSSCTPTMSWALSWVGSDWNDRTASALSYGSCHHYHHYHDSNYGRPEIDCNTYCATMGSMTDQTSSESWDY
jgi:hypothetical protein